MTRQVIALFILTICCTGSNSIPSVSFDPFDHPPEDAVIHKLSNVVCPDNESVNLSGLNIAAIPEKVVKSRTIRSINLNNNNIQYLRSDAFSETPNLSCLNLAGNELLPESVGLQHDGLKTLILDHQKYSTNLELLHEAARPSLQNLETLSWKGISRDFGEQYLTIAPKLRNLYLSNRNLAHINIDIGMAMPYLKTLHVEGNRITDSSKVYFGNLEALYLDKNLNFGTVVSDPFNAPNLRILSLSYCNLTELPFIEIPSLEVLDLSHNKFTTLPYLSNIINLAKLSLSYNLIENVSKIFAPSSLVTLNLRGNGITRIDNVAFQNLVMLRNLDLSENKLQHLPSDWNGISRFLRYLNLKSNRFLKLQDTGVHRLTNLKRLYVNGNVFNYIDLSMLENYVPPNCTVHVV